MFTLLLILTFVLWSALLLTASMHPKRPEFALAELERRAASSPGYKAQLERAQTLEYIDSFQRIVVALLLVLTVILSISTFGWLFGVLVAVLVAVSYPALARNQLVHTLGQRLYDRYEPGLLRMAHALRPTLRLLGSGLPLGEKELRVDSIEELSEMLRNSTEVLSKQQTTLLQAALAFDDKKVRDFMTPRGVIKSIRKEEFLGPLVLDELHAQGFSRLPVTDGDIDHVVGVLHLRDMLSLDNKRSTTAEKAMEHKVYYIHEADTLEHALAAFLKVRHHLFLVINDTRETVGLLTLEDVIEALIGRRIIDECDTHADLREVAKRQGRTNNAGPGRVDL